MEENKREWMYDAFISYRHLEPDAFVAGSLHKILESYKLPGNLVKANGDKLKRTRIKKVFRDAEELPLTSNLNDTIMTALENSEYLIAICSPKFGESLWCKKEVDTFIKLRGADHVLTVLVDGEPADSFPEALLYKDVEKVMEDGSVQVVRDPMEPLAANARGASNKERLKLLKTESLRLMAPMFGCSFDDLKQRHREQKLKRTIRIIGGVAAVCLMFGIVSTSMALQISKQNEQIMKQNDMIMDQNNQITLQAKTIQEQYDEAVISNANAVADYSRNLYEDGDRLEAIERAYSVFDMNSYVPKVEYVLSDALNLYENGKYLKADRIIKCNSLVKYVAFSPSSEYVAIRTNDDVVSIYNTKTGKLLDSFVLDKWSTEENSFVFRDDKQLYFVNGEAIALYDMGSKQSKVLAAGFENNCKLSYSADKDLLLAVDGNGAKLFDASSEEMICNISDSLHCFDSSLISSGKDDYFVLFFSDYSYSNSVVKVCRTLDGEVIGTIELDDVSDTVLRVYGDKFYLITNKCGDMLDSSKYIADFYKYELGDGQLTQKWKKSYTGVLGRDVVLTKGGESDNVLLQLFDQIEIVDDADASFIRKYAFDSSIVKAYGYKESDLYSVALRDGEWHAINTDLAEPIDTRFFLSTSSNIERHIAGSCTATVEYSSSEVVLYRYAISEDAVETDEHKYVSSDDYGDIEIREMLKESGVNEAFVHNVCFDNTNRFICVTYMNRSVDIFRLDSDKKIVGEGSHFDGLNMYVNNIEFSPDGNNLILNDISECLLLRTQGVDLDNELPTEDLIVADITNFSGIDFENNKVYVKNVNTYYEIPLYSSEEIGKIAKRLIDETK